MFEYLGLPLTGSKRPYPRFLFMETCNLLTAAAKPDNIRASRHGQQRTSIFTRSVEQLHTLPRGYSDPFAVRADFEYSIFDKSVGCSRRTKWLPHRSVPHLKTARIIQGRDAFAIRGKFRVGDTFLMPKRWARGFACHHLPDERVG